MMFQHSLYQVIFIQAAIIFETGHDTSRHVAVPVSGTGIVHFMPTIMSKMYIAMTRILYTRITLFCRPGSQKMGILRSGIDPALYPAAPTALGDIPGYLSAGNSQVYCIRSTGNVLWSRFLGSWGPMNLTDLVHCIRSGNGMLRYSVVSLCENSATNSGAWTLSQGSQDLCSIPKSFYFTR